MAFTQANRRLKIDTPFGADVLLLVDLHGHEGISALFSYEMELISEKPSLSFDTIVGKAVSASIMMEKGNRYISGIVSRFSQTSTRVDFTTYAATVVPWIWFLTRTSDCRIFQKLSAPDIIKKIFGEYGYSDYKLQLQGTHDPREYCVQYRETDYNFIARLMEEEGIFYFFEHEKGKHTLIIGDNPDAHKDCPGKSTVRFVHTTDVGTDEDIVLRFDKEQEVRPGKYAINDYNFKNPNLDLLANTAGQDPYKYEIYDYPGEYEKRDEGDRLVKIRQQEEDAPRVAFVGTGHMRSFTAGYKFTMSKHPAFDGPYVLTSVDLHATESGSVTSGDAQTDSSYDNSFHAMPAATPFRPARTTPEPKILGAQTAVVVGPKGEEIWVDEYGRVKVQFFWDREGKRDENSSCWIRVSQNWAGNRWGAMFIPRIGQEVIVHFLEGDPDRPIITGRVYNADQVVPYDLPDEKTKSTIKSRSSKGGSPSNWNELRFEDKKGNEQIFINAERDMDLRVENESREFVGASKHLIVSSKFNERVDGDHNVHVGNSTTKVDQDLSLNVVMNRNEKVGLIYSTEAGQEIHLKAGMKVIIEAGLQLTLMGAGGFIDIGPAGITINGTLVNINSGGAPGQGTPAQTKDPTDPDVADDGTKTGKL